MCHSVIAIVSTLPMCLTVPVVVHRLRQKFWFCNNVHPLYHLTKENHNVHCPHHCSISFVASFQPRRSAPPRSLSLRKGRRSWRRRAPLACSCPPCRSWGAGVLPPGRSRCRASAARPVRSASRRAQQWGLGFGGLRRCAPHLASRAVTAATARRRWAVRTAAAAAPFSCGGVRAPRSAASVGERGSRVDLGTKGTTAQPPLPPLPLPRLRPPPPPLPCTDAAQTCTRRHHRPAARTSSFSQGLTTRSRHRLPPSCDQISQL